MRKGPEGRTRSPGERKTPPARTRWTIGEAAVSPGRANAALQLGADDSYKLHPAHRDSWKQAGVRASKLDESTFNLNPSEEQKVSSQDMCDPSKASGCFPANLPQPGAGLSRGLVMQGLTQMSGSKANTAKATGNNCQMRKDFSHC